MSKYILALDQGTTSSRAIIFDRPGNIISIKSQEIKQHFPNPGWVEHDANEIWISQLATAKLAMTEANSSAEDIAAIGISNQRETTVLWNKETGMPIYNAIGWQDRRTSEIIDTLKQQGLTAKFKQKTGLVLDAYFSGSKLKWLLDNVPEARTLALNNQLAFGTIDSWVIWNLTNHRSHVTDPSNASRTLLYNIYTAAWDEELLDILNIPKNILPEVVPSSGILGEASSGLFGKRIPIAGVAGDQQAATFGNRCFQTGTAKSTFGTGLFLLMNTGEKTLDSKHHLLTTIAWEINKKITYCIEGSVFIGGAITQWLRDGLGIISNSSEIESLATSVPNNGGVVMVPAFAGLGAPYWDQYARGAIFGITRGTTKAHIARASMEALAFQVYDLVKAMENDSGVPISTLRVDGGACKNDFLMQFQADILNVPIERPKCLELSAMGAAFLAGLAVNYWRDEKELESIYQIDKIFTPQMPEAQRSLLLNDWHEGVSRSQHWVTEHRKDRDYE